MPCGAGKPEPVPQMGYRAKGLRSEGGLCDTGPAAFLEVVMRVWRKRLGGGVVVCFALLCASPVACGEESETLKEAQRSAPGTLVGLPTGVTHYELRGPKAGPVVVLIHGFNGPMTSWDHTMKPLVAAGYRVLRYDLVGRGYSERPARVYDLEVFVEQLGELLETLGVTEPVTLVGSSFGCVVGAEFAVRHPARVAGLSLIGPAGFPGPSSRMRALLSVPLLSDWVYRGTGDPMMRRQTHAYYVRPERFPEAHEAFARQQRIRGFKRAALSTLRNAPVLDHEPGWRRLGQSEISVQLIWGKDDVSFPYENKDLAMSWIPQAKLTTIEGAAHLPAYEAPEPTHRALLAFLRRVAQASGP